MKNIKFKDFVDKFNNNRSDLHHRYASFDICYNYFRRNKECLTDDVEKSCCVLWSYLGSWGMLRGSSFLLQDKNPAFLAKLIGFIQNDCQDLYDIDVNNYNQKNIKYNDISNIKRLCDVYDKIYELLGGSDTTPSSTLITKIMLGVFGCIPAFDQFFCDTFGNLMPRSGMKSKIVSEKCLDAICDFYYPLNKMIDDLAVDCKIVDPFKPGAQNGHYTRAKIIDMFGFENGLTVAIEKKAAENK